MTSYYYYYSSSNYYYYRNYNYNYKWRLILLIVSSSPSSMTRHPPLRLQWPISCLVYTFLHSPLSIHLLYYFPTPPTSAATTTTTSTTTTLLLLHASPAILLQQPSIHSISQKTERRQWSWVKHPSIHPICSRIIPPVTYESHQTNIILHISI